MTSHHCKSSGSHGSEESSETDGSIRSRGGRRGAADGRRERAVGGLRVDRWKGGHCKLFLGFSRTAARWPRIGSALPRASVIAAVSGWHSVPFPSRTYAAALGWLTAVRPSLRARLKSLYHRFERAKRLVDEAWLMWTQPPRALRSTGCTAVPYRYADPAAKKRHSRNATP